MTRRSVLILASLLSVAACSSMPGGPQFAGIDSTPKSTESLLYVYRPNAYYGKAISYPILLNGKKIADLGNNGYFALTVQPGKYTIQPDTDSIDHEHAFEAAPGETLFLRVKVNRKPALCFCTSLEFENADRASATSELAATRKEIERVYGY